MPDANVVRSVNTDGVMLAIQLLDAMSATSSAPTVVLRAITAANTYKKVLLQLIKAPNSFNEWHISNVIDPNENCKLVPEMLITQRNVK